MMCSIFWRRNERTLHIAKLQEEVTKTYVLEHSGDYLQIQDQQGDWIYRSSFFEKAQFCLRRVPISCSNLYEDCELAAAISFSQPKRSRCAGRHFVVQTGARQDDILRTLSYIQAVPPDIRRSDAGGSVIRRLLAEREGPCPCGCAHPNRAQSSPEPTSAAGWCG